MSQKIGRGGVESPGLEARAELPWAADAGEEVRSVRRAITAERHDDPVDSEVAPMMGELLARLDALVAPGSPSEVSPPAVPDPVHPPGPEEASALLSRAGAKLRQVVARADPELARRLEPMLQVVEAHMQMKQEAVARSHACV